MKTKTLLSLMFLPAVMALGQAAPRDPAEAQIQNYSKNLARHHVGSNLFLFNTTNRTYVPNEAAAAWLDDDMTTGWPPLAGRQHYLLSLNGPELLTNFCISAKEPAAGTVTLYAGDDPAAPDAKSWSLLAKDLSLDSINNKKLIKPFTRFAKYLLIETNLADAGPWFSLHVYGEKPATAYHLQRRTQPINVQAIFGPYVNEQTAINLNGLYARGRVAHANTASGAAWQRAIDDNPESAVTVQPTKTESGMVIRCGEPRAINRISVLGEKPVKGKLELFLFSEPAAQPPPPQPATAAVAGSQYLRVANQELAAVTQPGHGTPAETPAALALEGKPTATIVFDGSSARSAIDFSALTGSLLAVRWTPDDPNQALGVREIASFGDQSLNDVEVASLAPISERLDDADYKGGKEVIDPKQPLPPVGEMLPGKAPFIPGLPGFPPNFATNRPQSP